MMESSTAYSPWVRWVFHATFLEYVIFGIIDPLYSVFVQSVVQNYFLVGVVFGVRAMIGLLAVFFFTRVLKTLPAVQGLFIAQVLVFVGFIGFFFTGLLGSVVLLFICAAINGFAFMLKQSSKQNILMEEITGKNASTVMGRHVAIKYTCWSVGMFLGGLFLFLLGDIEMHYAYLSIAGVWLFSYFLFVPHFKEFISIPWKKLGKDVKDVVVEDKLCFSLFGKIKEFSSPLNFSIALCFFMEMTSRVSLLFVPLLAQSLGLPLWQIFLLTAFMLLPMVFTFLFSSMADKYDRITLIIYGIAFSLFPLIFLSTTDSPMSIAIASGVISLCIALLQPSVLGLAGNLAPRKEKNTVVQLELFFTNLGSIVGGVGLGAVAQIYGIQTAFLVVACIAVLFLCTALWLHFYLAKHVSAQQKNLPKTAFQKIAEHTHFSFQRHLGS